ncbi:uncharacterized protein C8Q71DRAFT_743429 [Rhodofomes roseus]|uniref:DUF6533 domain-containing protein n=1 Tax=Rhodofomes roseus TaxID=34475 RepID=A0ABQ8KR41_9APHY|nr:uncharacterized protein C8Q71DRAFT_743429 [Rhodofomes roseus]KAH9841103.1 hypothetical protein C8Q71DRAFT_743429 [Rhodofomes roseus]
MATFEPMEVPTTYGVTYMSEVYVAGFCTISISVLIVYEYIITIADEVRHFWHGRFTGSKILFFMNRYALLSHGVLSLGTTVSLNTAGCADATVLLSLCIFILYATEAVFAAMRAFAITGYNWPTALFVLALGSIPVWANVYLITRTRYFVERFGNVVACANTLDVSADSYFTDHIPAYYSAIIVGALGSILSDALVLVITWWKLWGFKRAADRARVSTPLVAVILRDGSLYFVALAALNIVQTLVQIYAKDTAYF